MPQRIQYQKFKIFGHLFFWLFSIFLLSFIFYLYDSQFNLILIEKAFITNLGFALAVYTNIYILIPKFLKLKNYIFYIFWLIVTISFSSVLIQFLFIYPFHDFLRITDEFKSFNPNLHSAYFFSTLVYVAITSFLKFIKEWLSLQDLNLKLAKIEQQKLEAELNTLKSQLNPHFLFNSLNNIYSLALVKSDKVPELILKLSDLMRHIIYESKEKYISLEKEIDFVNNFVALQKIRTSENTKIKYEITGDIPDAKIAPLLFEPFIDNAFKHGLPGTNGEDFIHIGFSFDKDSLHFRVENNYEETNVWNKKASGIGIENVKQRLKLLYKKDEYQLKIDKTNHTHQVILILKLK